MNVVIKEKLRKISVLGLAALCFLAPLKFTQLVIFHATTAWPSNGLEWMLSAWPASIFYFFLAGLFLMVLPLFQWKRLYIISWLFPCLFLFTQFISTFASVDLPISYLVVRLFLSLAAAYLLGAQILKTKEDIEKITFAWLAGSVLVMVSGVYQANGGLEEVKRLLHQHPELIKQNPKLSDWAESTRIFGTFISPNALGSYIVATIFVAGGWFKCAKLNFLGRLLTSGILILALFYCLWQSGSKANYLILFITLIIGILLLTQNNFQKLSFLSTILLVALIGFWFGYGQSKDDRGITESAITVGKRSLENRIAFWRAAWKIGWERPLLGSGPGTFARKYPFYKKVEEEDVQLVHNNYLQMWCDSGLGGFITFILWLPGSLALWWYRWRNQPPSQRIIQTLLWCACVTFALHSLVDFDLYMVSNSWPIFLLLGFLSASTPEK